MVTHRILDLCCSPVGSTFISSSSSSSSQQEGRLSLWNMKIMKQDRVLQVAPNQPKINSSRFNHNGTMLVTGAADGQIRVFDMGTCNCIMSWKAHEGEVYSVQFSFDETSIFSLGSDNQVCVVFLNYIFKFIFVSFKLFLLLILFIF